MKYKGTVMNHSQLTQSSKQKLNSLDSLETNQLLIAITSQNKKHVTPHAGKCRKFWLYKIVQDGDATRVKSLNQKRYTSLTKNCVLKIADNYLKN